MMLDVKKVFGVDFNEAFKINECPNVRFMFTVHGLFEFSVFGSKDASDALQKLVTGEYTIKEKPFKAKIGEVYYVPLMNDSSEYPYAITAKDVECNDNSADSVYYTCGLMCKTKEKAKELGELLIKTAKEFQGFDING